MDSIPDNLPTAPPPPAEVKVRTMRSDLASMAKSGGGMPKFESVKISGLSGGAAAAPGNHSKGNFLRTLVVILVIAALGIGGWFAYANFIVKKQATGSQAQQQQPSGPAPVQSNPITVPTTTPPAPSGSVPILKLGS